MRAILAVLWMALCVSWAHGQEQPIFSGPQVDEKLPPLVVKSLAAGEETKTIDLIKEAGNRPTVFIFFHQVTRPAAAVMRTVSEYAKTLNGKVFLAVAMLSEDETKTRQWADAARSSLPRDVVIGIAPDGKEGPGSYGLNRNVTLTVLVAKGGVVKNNFALVQPSDAVDVPKIAKAIAEVAGVAPPTQEQLARLGPAMRREAGMVNESEVRALLSPIIQKASSKEQVEEAAAKLEAKAKTDAAFKKDIGDRCRRIVEGGALQNYGNEHGQAYIKKWSESFR